ncbi:urease accessory protein UreD [Pedobacter sp. L105]|uniref:urease accessory protein UreD n=1 Tax=Pedobacter sp. L105 TaxID=1641871 RepID=UPI00131DBEC8|nr:urease accessory protein UreD [Pedobacter sp. L105]
MLGCLKLHIVNKDNRSSIADLYFTAPFKVMNISPRKAVKLDLMMMSSSPGILDQDEYQVEITLEKDCWLNLFNQAYQLVYPSSAGTKQQQVLSLGENSTLVYLATPLVPHRDANFISKTKVYLEDKAMLILGEIITCGRTKQEEPFAFSLLKLDIEIEFKEEGLIFKEKQHLEPGAASQQQLGLYAQFTHQASLYIFNNRWDHVSLTKELTGFLSEYNGTELSWGVTPSYKYGTIVKLLGTKAEELVKLLDQLKEMLLQKKSAESYE